MKKIISIIALTALSVFAHAEDEWVLVGGNEQTKVYLSANKIKDKSPIAGGVSELSHVEAWVKFVFQKKIETIGKDWFSMNLYKFSCPADEVTYLYTAVFNKTGEKVVDYSEEETKIVIPGTLDESITRSACDYLTGN